MKSSIEIGMLSVRIPVDPSPMSEVGPGGREELLLEIYSWGLQVWGEGWGGDHYDLKPGSRNIGKLPQLDSVFAFLAEQRAAHRSDHIGVFLDPILAVMESAIADRDGSSVYFAEAAGQVKIGWSRKVATRLAQLQTGCASPLHLLGTMPGGRAAERRVHEQFAHLRLTGEWFTAAPELLAYVDEVSAR